MLVVTKIDRIARPLRHLLTVAHELETKSVDLIVLDQQIDTTTPAGKLTFQILGAIAEFERTLIVERVKAGMAHAQSTARVQANPSAGRGMRSMSRRWKMSAPPRGHQWVAGGCFASTRSPALATGNTRSGVEPL